MLSAHEPYPAVVMDRHWNVVMTNSAAGALFRVLGERELAGPTNVIRLMFHPDALRPFVANWDAAAEALFSAFTARPSAAFPIPKRSRCLPKRWLSGVPSEWRSPDFRTPALPIVPIEFAKDGLALSYFFTVKEEEEPGDERARGRDHRRPRLASDRGRVAGRACDLRD